MWIPALVSSSSLFGKAAVDCRASTSLDALWPALPPDKSSAWRSVPGEHSSRARYDRPLLSFRRKAFPPYWIVQYSPSLRRKPVSAERVLRAGSAVRAEGRTLTRGRDARRLAAALTTSSEVFGYRGSLG